MTKPSKWVRTMDFGSGRVLDFRKVGPRAFQYLEIIDMNDACGRDNEGHDKYVCELKLVDLSIMSEKQMKDVRQSCGWDEAPDTDESLAEMAQSYGASAPLYSCSGNSWGKLLREARKEANNLLDPDALDEALDRPVNALGSTAREYASGDFDSALTRGVHSGDQNARIMAKMHGIPDHVIDDSRPADFLPYLMGYMTGMHGGPADKAESGDPEDAIAPEYFQGYQRGINVSTGKCPAPSWLK